MKKISLLLVLALLLTVLPVNLVTVSAATASYPSYLLEDFEGDTFNDVSTSKMYATNFTSANYSVKGPASDKCLFVATSLYQASTPGKNYGPVFDFAARNGYTYDMSVWIKCIYDLPSDNSVTFVVTSNGKEYPTKVSNAGLKLGEWVKVSATYTHNATDASPITGDFHILLGDGKTTEGLTGAGRQYALDDVTVMPREYYVGQTSGVSGLKNYKFSNDSSIPNSGTSTSNGFRIENGTSSLTSKGTGKYLTITDDGTGKAKLIREDVDFRHGVEYRVTVSLKGNNAAAYNATPEIYIDRSGREDRVNITSDIVTRGSYIINGGGGSPKLTSEWRTYEFPIRIDTPTFDATDSKFVIGLSGDSIGGASFSVYDISLYENSNIRYEYSKVLTAGGGFNASYVSGSLYNVDVLSCVTAGNVTQCLTQILVPYNGDYALAKTFKNWENNERFQLSVTDEQAKGMIMKVTPKDHHEYYGATYATEVNITKDYGYTAVAEFDQTVWAPDMPELTATIRYNAPTGDENLKALCATYDNENRMLSHDIEVFELSQGEGEIKLSMDVSSTSPAKNATRAQVFLWDDSSHAPKTFGVEALEKTQNGTFIYVHPDGVVNTTYGYSNPVPTFQDAVNAFSSILKATPSAEVYVILHPGYHFITEKVSIDGSMTSANGQVKITSLNKNDKGILSGGKIITGTWSKKKTVDAGTIWYIKDTSLAGLNLRHLYVKGTGATRARYEGPFPGAVNTSTYNQYGYVSPGGNNNGKLGVLKMNTDNTLLNLTASEQSQLECVFYTVWTNSRCGVESITDNGDGTMTFNMVEPSWTLGNNKGNGHVTTPAWIENAVSFIDKPGEFCFDKDTGTIYYLARDGEFKRQANPTKAVCTDTNGIIVPVFDNYKGEDGALIEFIGTYGNEAQNITFDGVEISHTNWSRPSTIYGHHDEQNNHKNDVPTLKFDKDPLDTEIGGEIDKGHLREAAIDLMYAKNIDFLNCSFNRLGITGIRMSDGTDNCDITGCEFYDIAGSAITMGEPYQGLYNNTHNWKALKGNLDSGEITQEYYDQVFNQWKAEEEEARDNAMKEERMLDNNTINNCYIHHVATDFWSAAAISAGNPRNARIANNEICYIPYSGMHIGYGWDTVYESSLSGMVIEGNYIHDLFKGEVYDGGAIYTLGRTGGTAENPNIIRNNYIENVYVGGAGIYNDQGSSAWLVENNVVDIRNVYMYYNGRKFAPSKWCNVNFTKNDGSGDVTFYEKNVTWRNNYAAFNNAYTPFYARPTVTVDGQEQKGYDNTNSFSAVYLDSVTGKWPSAAYNIMAAAGITDEFKSNFKYGLQNLKVASQVELSAGEEYSNTPCIVGSKNAKYKNGDMVINVTSSNEAVAKADVDTITAVAAGNAVITYTIIENGIVTESTTKVSVK